MSTHTAIAGAGFALAGGIVGIIGAVRRAKAIKRAAEQASKFEDFKFREFLDDARAAERDIQYGNQQRFAAAGIDFRSGSPLAVAVDVANEYSINIERARREALMNKEQIELDARAGRSSSIVSGVASGLNAATSVVNILGKP